MAPGVEGNMKRQILITPVPASQTERGYILHGEGSDPFIDKFCCAADDGQAGIELPAQNDLQACLLVCLGDSEKTPLFIAAVFEGDQLEAISRRDTAVFGSVDLSGHVFTGDLHLYREKGVRPPIVAACMTVPGGG